MITLLNGEEWAIKDILKKMDDDSFYYGHLGDKVLSSSSMKPLLTSPKAYLKSINEDSNRQAYRDGRLIHMHILEKQKLGDLVTIEGTKATKAFKEATAEFGSHMVYTTLEMNNASRIANSVLRNDDAMELLDGADFELPGIKEWNGVPIRGKADAKKGKTIIDLKSCTGIEKFKWSARNFNYGLQAALYMWLFDADEFIFIAVDKDTQDVGIYDCSEMFLSEGWDKAQEAIENYRQWFLDNNNSAEFVKNFTIRETL